MNIRKMEDVRDTAIKLDAIRTNSPEDYGYLKGWIHCLLWKKRGVAGSEKGKAEKGNQRIGNGEKM